MTAEAATYEVAVAKARCAEILPPEAQARLLAWLVGYYPEVVAHALDNLAPPSVVPVMPR